MEHRNYSDSPTCQSCRYWSEMVAQSNGPGPIQALCLNSKSEQSGKWVTGASRCEAWVDGPYGAIDQPGGDPYQEQLCYCGDITRLGVVHRADSFCDEHPAQPRKWVELPTEVILEEANKQLSPRLFAMGAAWASVQLEELNK